MTTTEATDFDIARLRARRTNKWHKFPPDVLPAWVADMDFAAPPGETHAILLTRARRDQSTAREYRGVGRHGGSLLSRITRDSVRKPAVLACKKCVSHGRPM